MKNKQAEPEQLEPAGPPFTFRDKNGEQWEVGLTLGGARRIDAADFSELTDKKFSILTPEKTVFMELLSNSSLVFGMIWVLVQDQVEANLSIDPAEEPDRAELAFVDSLDGQAIEKGKRAFWGALADFFPEHKTALLILIQQVQKTEARIGMELKGIIPDLERVMNQEISAEVDKLKTQLNEVGGKSSE